MAISDRRLAISRCETPSAASARTCAQSIAPRTPFPASSIADNVNDDRGSRTLDTHIAALRNKIGPAVPIRTIHGVGYRLLADRPELIG